jgi:hypothetical protein
MHPVVRWTSGLVPLLLALVALWAWADGSPQQPAPRGALAFARHFIHYGLFEGATAGTPRHPWRERIAVEQLAPGDIILCGNPGAVHGAWSHATIVLDDGRVLAQDLLRGIGVEAIAGLAWYDRLRVLRPRVPAAVRTAAARAAQRRIGAVFNLVAHPCDPWQLSCARCVADAYRDQGVDITDGRFWVTPDALADGPLERIIDR